jgi:predicted acetyltransferase
LTGRPPSPRVTVSPDQLSLRPPGRDDESACRRAQAELTDYHFLLLWDPERPWDEYVDLLDGLRDGSAVPDDFVPSTFLLAEADGEIVGRLSVRFALNDFLATQGGHVGYAVLPRFRRRGYATALLRHGMAILSERGVSRILVTCDDDNAPSARVIERCGGVFESFVTTKDGTPLRRYWIDHTVSP